MRNAIILLSTLILQTQSVLAVDLKDLCLENIEILQNLIEQTTDGDKIIQELKIKVPQNNTLVICRSTCERKGNKIECGKPKCD